MLSLVAVLVLAAPRARAADAPSDTTVAPRDTLEVVPPPGVPAPFVVTEGNPEGLPIARIDIEPRNIFDPLPEGRLRPLLRLANRLHVKTRPSTIQDQLLFGAGEPWSDALAHETVRNLRDLSFLDPTRITARRQGDSVAVRVITRDVWTTRADFNIESADGVRYGSIGFTELNFLGLGKGFSLSYRDLPTGTSRGISFTDPSVQGSRVRLHYAASNGSAGATDEVSIGQPFYAEDARRAFGLSWSRATSVFTLFNRGLESAHFDRRNEEARFYYGEGRRVFGTIVRGTVYANLWDRRFGPTVGEGPLTPEEFIGGEENLRLRTVGVEARAWRPKHIERTRVDGFGLIEDFDVGHSLEGKAGYASQYLGSSQDEGYLYGAMRTGFGWPALFGWFSGSASSRIQTIGVETLMQANARLVQQSRLGQTLVLAGHGTYGINMARDYQAVVGGLNGLRAYPVHAVSGTRLWRLNAENRWTVGENFWENVTIGAVVFTDAARAWGPGSVPTWFVAAGTGLRVTLPQWSLGQILRFDVAWPIDPTRDGRREPVLSFGSSQAF